MLSALTARMPCQHVVVLVLDVGRVGQSLEQALAVVELADSAELARRDRQGLQVPEEGMGTGHPLIVVAAGSASLVHRGSSSLLLEVLLYHGWMIRVGLRSRVMWVGQLLRLVLGVVPMHACHHVAAGRLMVVMAVRVRPLHTRRPHWLHVRLLRLLLSSI